MAITVGPKILTALLFNAMTQFRELRSTFSNVRACRHSKSAKGDDKKFYKR
jgi:hypothetical protein